MEQMESVREINRGRQMRLVMKVRWKRSERTHTESDGTKGNCVFDGSQVCYTDGPQTWQVAFGLMVSSLTSGLCVCVYLY